jgi:Icc-related predicted phosphoesterase
LTLEILALTDIHDRVRYVKELSKIIKEYKIAFDIVIVAGDLTYFREVEHGISILKLIAISIGRPVLFVPGNCDSPKLLELDSIREYEIYNIHTRIFKYKGYYFYGVGGSNITPFSTLIEWSEEDIEKLLRKAWSIPREKLIMVTHIPIYGVMDEVYGENVGSRTLREFLDSHGAKLWITGHLHEYSGYRYVNGVYVVNPGPLMKGYYALISIDENIDVVIRNIHNRSKYSG